jgi:hypothetical protein
LKQPTVRTLLVVITILTLVQAVALPPSIGVASARGVFWLDNGRVSGNATLFDGAVLETAKATSDVSLGTGVQVLLGTESRCKLYRDRMVLEKGVSQIEAAGNYRVQAGQLRIVPVSAKSKGVVAIKSANLVEAAALTGGFRVMTANGVLIANLHPGRPLAFDTEQAGAFAPTTVTGVVKPWGKSSR